MFNLGKNEEEETRKFWSSVEEETGTPVLEHALGQYFSGYEGYEGPSWGLLYLTKEALYFRHFPSSNWFSAIISSEGGKKRDDGFVMQVAVASISDVARDQPASLWKRVFRPKPPVTIVRYDDGTEMRELRIAVEHRADVFFESLRSLL